MLNLSDEIPQDEEHIYITLSLYVIYKIIAIIGIIFAMVCLVINLWLRNQKYVSQLLYLTVLSIPVCIFLQISETWQSLC